MDLGNFNPEDHKAEGLSAGDHLAIVESSEERKTKAGDGSYLNLTFQIVDGPEKGRRHWERFNLNNPSDKAVEIAKRELASLCRALKVERPTNSQELHSIPFVLRVKHRGDEIKVKYLPQSEWKDNGAPADPNAVPF